ncbi:MAG: hypothetical protein PHR35_12600 [Kiritimatiellae bacterium]|nr:hypothetical protein [Kiritimatiellia bacterium]
MRLARHDLPGRPDVNILAVVAVFAILYICLAVACCASEPPVVPAERWIVAETPSNTVWSDRMTDGSERQSIVRKTPQPVYVCLVETQDVGFAWRFYYRVRRDDGSCITNSHFATKPKKAVLNETLAKMDALRDGPPMPTNAPAPDLERMEQVAAAVRPAAARNIMREVTEHRKRLARVYNLSERMLPDGRAEYVRSDGGIVTGELVRVVSARRTPPAAHLLAAEVRALADDLGVDFDDKKALAAAIKEARKKLKEEKEDKIKARTADGPADDGWPSLPAFVFACGAGGLSGAVLALVKGKR